MKAHDSNSYCTSGLEVDLNSCVIGTNGKAILVSNRRASFQEASMVKTALAVTRYSMVLYLVASRANTWRRPSSGLREGVTPVTHYA